MPDDANDEMKELQQHVSRIAAEATEMRNKLRDFLQAAPLKKPVNGLLAQKPTTANVHYPTLNMFCEWCGREQTFQLETVYKEPGYGSDEITLLGKTFVVVYACQAHMRIRGATRAVGSFIWFLLRFHKDGTVEKMGQYPRNETSIDPRVAPLLGDQKLYYRRGCECEDEGFGLGSVAYFRRVVESIIDKLLSELRDLIPEKDREKYEGALSSVEKDRRASEKIQAVQDLLPESLNISGQNPLKLLHSVLSEGLHKLDDSSILEIAQDTRRLVDYLLLEVSDKKNRAEDATKALRKLLQRSEKSE